MATTIRTREPRELLSLIPYQLGFQPAQSAVLVSLRGERSRVGLVARVDLDDLADADGAQVARSLVSHLVRDGARSAVLVLYTPGPAAHPDHRVAAARAHLAAAAEHHLGELPCWVVGVDGYRSPDCLDPACCPPGGRPLADLQSTRVGAHMVLTGAGVLASREDVGVIGAASPAARRSARRAADRWLARGAAAPDTATEHGWRRAGLSTWRAAVADAAASLREAVESGTAAGQGAGRGAPSWRAPSATAVGRLQAALDDVLVRDAVMVGLVPGNERVADRVVAGDSGADVGAALRVIVDPVEGREPEPVLAAASTAVLEAVVAHSPRHAQAPALTLLAVLAWWHGDGARAAVLVERALVAAPEYRLGVLMDQTLRTGMPPGWLRGAGT